MSEAGGGKALNPSPSMRTTAAGDASATASLRASDGIGALPSFPAKAKKVPKTNGFRNFCVKSLKF